MFGAFFIATDPVTAPRGRLNQVIYASIIGLITVVIRQGEQYPDGVAFAVILANIIRPSLIQVQTLIRQHIKN